jgi:putative transposase
MATNNMEKYQGKYRIPSARWAAWDYGSNAAYFVTICTDDRTHSFGRITAGVMAQTSLGQASVDCWNAIPDHFPFVILDGFVVMPNHVHGIIVIAKPDIVQTQYFASPHGIGTHDIASPDIGTQNPASLGNQTQNLASPGNQTQNLASPGNQTQNLASLPIPLPRNKFGPQSQNLASIIRGFKSA